MRNWRFWLLAGIWTLAILIQWPLWFGRGGWLRVQELEDRLQDKVLQIERDKTANEALMAEVMSLREGRSAIEERARRELYMVRSGEVLFRVKGSPEEQARLAAEEARRAADEMKAEARALERAKAAQAALPPEDGPSADLAKKEEARKGKSASKKPGAAAKPAAKPRKGAPQKKRQQAA